MGTVLFFGGISFLSNEFPPKITTVKKYVHQFLNAKNQYAAIINRSHNGVANLQLEGFDDIKDTNKSGRLPASLEDTSGVNENSRLEKRIKSLELKMQLLEEQNKILIEKLSQ